MIITRKVEYFNERGGSRVGVASHLTILLVTSLQVQPGRSENFVPRGRIAEATSAAVLPAGVNPSSTKCHRPFRDPQQPLREIASSSAAIFHRSDSPPRLIGRAFPSCLDVPLPQPPPPGPDCLRAPALRVNTPRLRPASLRLPQGTRDRRRLSYISSAWPAPWLAHRMPPSRYTDASARLPDMAAPCNAAR